MSFLKIDEILNNNPEQVQGQTEANPAEEKCNMKDSSVIGMVERENIKNLASDMGCSSGKFLANPIAADKNLNKPIDIKQEVGAVKCDTNSVDVDNITNSLVEKTKCDKTSTNPTQNIRATAQRLIRDSLIHKVNELDISGRVNQKLQSNKSSVIIKKESDSLRNILVYDNSSDDDDDFEKNWQLMTFPDSFSDSESDSNESLESSSEEEGDADGVSVDVIFGGKNTGAIKKDTSKTGEVIKNTAPIETLEGPPLPPLPDLSLLSINYEKEEFLHMGEIQAIIDILVTVEALPGTPAYDLDSYLFIEDKTTKRPLGTIYDVIGPVTSPMYCIRFNSTKEIQDLNLKHGLKVFSAPKSQYTRYVFVKELMKIKGTDASWIGDNELPPEVAAELSDEEDEHEHILPNARKAQKRKHGSLERHKQFEKSMNHCNTLNTRVAQLVDAHRNLSRPNRPNDNPPRSLQDDYRVSSTNHLPIPFDPTIPPPGFQDYFRGINAPRIHPGHCNWLPQEMLHHMGHPSPFTQGQNNSANYYTNNAGRNHSAGPSTQPY